MEDVRGVVRLGMPYDQIPESKSLHRFLTDYCKHWRGTGLHLGLKSSVLDQVEADYHTLSERFRVTLEKWLQLNVDVTWRSLELAITNANRESLGLQQLIDTPASLSVIQSDHKDSRKNDEISQVDNDNVSNGAMVKRRFRDFVIMRLRQKYSKVVMKLIDIFEENDVDIEKLITILSFDDADKNSVFSTDSAFTTIRTKVQLFHHVSQYCKGIYDYQVLDVLVQASGCPEAIKELNDFTELLQNSILAEIDLISEHGELLHPDDFMSGTYKFIIEYVGGKCKLGTKEMVQSIVEQSVCLRKGVLIFKGFDVGSILFIYQISEAVKSYLLQYKFTEQDFAHLEGNNIISLIVDGVTIMSLVTKELHLDDGGAVKLKNKIFKQLDKLAVSLNPKDKEATFATLSTIFDNIIWYPHDDKHYRIMLTDETFNTEVWQYPAGEELMKMSGWVVEGDHLRLTDDSCVQIISQLLRSFLPSSATSIVPFSGAEFQVIIEAFYSGDIPCIQKLLTASHISPNGRIHSETGSSLNLLYTATIAQQVDIVNLLMMEYSVEPDYMSMQDNTRAYYIRFIFSCAPEPFIVEILKCHGMTNFTTTQGVSTLHYAVISNCLDVVHFLLEECNDVDVNVTEDDYLLTPLHLAYLYGHTQIAQYLIQCGANMYALDSDGYAPYEYICGNPDLIKDSEYIQNKKKIHHIPFSSEHYYFMKLINLGIFEKEAVSLTMEQFPSLKEDVPAYHDIDRESSLKEFTQYITISTQKSTGGSRKQLSSQVQGESQDDVVTISCL